MGKVEKRPWEGIKVLLTFEDAKGQPIDVTNLKFRFIYWDETGRSCEVLQEGDKRENCVCHDEQLIAIFEPGTFRRGKLTVERHFYRTDSDFKTGYWEYGGLYDTGIKIV